MTKLNLKPLGIYTDNILGCSYSLNLVASAKELSDELKSVLVKNNIDYKKYNRYTEDSFEKDKSVKTPPKEIYEYQNFFVLQRTNGDLILLDGFRRLLWYTPPSAPIIVRYYLESELTNQQILTLLVNLNHFKFFANNQSYYERGFSLLLKTVFDVDVTKFTSSFDAYLSRSETKSGYSDFGTLSGQEKNVEIKDRITNEFFVSDVKFLQRLKATGYLCDKYFGALLYELRSESKKEFDMEMFISMIKENNVLVELMEKYKKIGTEHSSKSIELVNKIIDMYRNIFTLMEGGSVEQSFAEKQKECKNLVEKLKKDKSLVKMTGSASIHDIEHMIEARLKKKEDLEFVCVVHPRDESGKYSNFDEDFIKVPHGLLEGVKFMKFTPKHLGMGAMEMNIGIKVGKFDCPIWHNYGGYSSYGKKYTRLRMPRGEYDVDLFVKMEVEKKPKSTEPRKLKQFSYRPHGQKRRLYLLAWTNKQAMEMFEEIGIRVNVSDMTNHVYKAWGNDGEEALKDIDRTQPCAYEIPTENDSPKGKPVKLKLKCTN